jgi:hypothetical protein
MVLVMERAVVDERFLVAEKSAAAAYERVFVDEKAGCDFLESCHLEALLCHSLYVLLVLLLLLLLCLYSDCSDAIDRLGP